MIKDKDLNILVVDDEKEICGILTKWLSLKGHRVKSVSTGKKALNLIKKEHFDVVFLDIVMPGISGVDVLEAMMQISLKTKLIMVTGKLVDNDLWNDLRRKGAWGFLQKPFKIEDMTATISR